MTPSENRRRLNLLRAEEKPNAKGRFPWLGTCPALQAFAGQYDDSAARSRAGLKKTRRLP